VQLAVAYEGGADIPIHLVNKRGSYDFPDQVQLFDVVAEIHAPAFSIVEVRGLMPSGSKLLAIKHRVTAGEAYGPVIVRGELGV
jgi:hypothetical protein